MAEFSASDISQPKQQFDASQIGQTKTIGQQISDIPKGFWDDMVRSGQGLVNLFTTRPDKTVKGIGAAQQQPLNEAVDAWKKGNRAEAVRHFLNYMIPFAGPSLDQQGNEAQAGNVGHALGGTLSTATQYVAPGAMEAHAPAIATGIENTTKAAAHVGAAAKTGAKAAAPDVAAGTAKAAAGMVASEVLPGGPVKYAAGAYPVYSGVRQIGKGLTKGYNAAKASFAERLAAATDAMAETPGQVLARSQGLSWGSLKPEEQATLENVARAQQNAAAQPPRPVAPAPTPAAPPEAAPAGANITVADLLRKELEDRRGAQPEPEAPEMIGAHEATPILPRAGSGPLRPPLAPQTAAPNPKAPAPRLNKESFGGEPEPPTPAPATAAPPPPANGTAPRPLTNAQAEAAMARTKPPEVDAPRSMYNANGERKSPQLRAQEIKNANIDAKAQRFAAALHDAGISVQEAKQIPAGRIGTDQLSQGGTPGWGNITDDLVSRGVLQKGEMPPNESIPKIIGYLKKLESQKIAQQLADEMRRSGTIQ